MCKAPPASSVQASCHVGSNASDDVNVTKTGKKGLPEKKALCSINHGVLVKPSTIPGANNGLFVDRDFKRGDWITYYDGDVKSVGIQDRELLSRGSHDDWSHVIGIDQYTVIQCHKEPVPGSGGGGFINDGINIFLPPNVKFVADSERRMVCVRATRDIKKGEELFVSYGRNYWNRFKNCLPDEYEKIIEPQVRSRTRAKGLLDSRDERGRLKPVLEGLKSTPVPVMPEWEGAQEYWSPEITRYAMFKARVIDGSVLKLDVLRNLDVQSDEYFDAVGRYAASLKGKPKRISGAWNSRLDKYQGLKIPQNGVFKPADKWSGSHIHAFFRQLKKGDYKHIENIKKCLDVVSPHSALYEELLEEYIQTETGLKTGDSLDLRTEAGRGIRKRLFKCLSRASSPVLLPVNFKGKPFASLQKTLNQKGDKITGWSFPAVYNIFEAMGINVIHFDRSKVSDLYTLEMNAKQDTPESETAYFQTLKSWSQKVGFDFKQVRLMKARHKRQSLRKGDDQDSPPLKFIKIDGLKLHETEFNAAGLFLQYIQHFGMDDPRIVVNFTSDNLYRTLKLFEQPVGDELQTLYEQLFALAWRGVSNKKIAFGVLNRHPELKLPASVSGMFREEAFETLNNKGKELMESISSLSLQDNAD